MSELTTPVARPVWLGWLAGAGAVLTLLLTVVSIGLQLAVNADQQALAGVRAYNAATPEVGRIDNTLIRALAVMAASKGDTQITDLLAGAGVHYKMTPKKPAP